MIIDNKNTNEVSSGGVLHTQQFTIAATAHAFKILSNTLYNDKQGAVLRELGTNAYDAHVDNGNPDEPFYVCVPTTMNPTFKIRDYGTGIHPDRFHHLYSSYFVSNKQHSNDFTGAFGIGKCSFYSCTDQCSIINYYNGQKFVYSAYIGSDDTPQITLMCEEDTTERNGLEVSFAVAHNEINLFQNKAAEIYRYFSTTPDVRGLNRSIDKFNPSWNEVVVEGIPVQYAVDNSISGVVIMGNVKYPVGSMSGKVLPSLVFKVPIGSVDITASRESLEYNQKTRNFLEKLDSVVYADYCKAYQNEVSQCKTLFEVIVLNVQKYNNSRITLSAEFQGSTIKSDKVGYPVPIGAIQHWKGEIEVLDKNTTYLCHARNIRYGRSPAVAKQLGLTNYKTIRVAQHYSTVNAAGLVDKTYEGQDLCNYLADYMQIDRSKVVFIDGIRVKSDRSNAPRGTRERYVYEISPKGPNNSCAKVSVPDAYYLVKKNRCLLSDKFVGDRTGHITGQLTKAVAALKIDRPIYIINHSDLKHLLKKFPKLKPFEDFFLTATAKYDMKDLAFRYKARYNIYFEDHEKQVYELIANNSSNQEALDAVDSLLGLKSANNDAAIGIFECYNNLVDYSKRVSMDLDAVKKHVKIKKETIVNHYPIFAPLLINKINAVAFADYITQTDKNKETEPCVQ